MLGVVLLAAATGTGCTPAANCDAFPGVSQCVCITACGSPGDVHSAIEEVEGTATCIGVQASASHLDSDSLAASLQSFGGLEELHVQALSVRDSAGTDATAIAGAQLHFESTSTSDCSIVTDGDSAYITLDNNCGAEDALAAANQPNLFLHVPSQFDDHVCALTDQGYVRGGIRMVVVTYADPNTQWPQQIMGGERVCFERMWDECILGDTEPFWSIDGCSAATFFLGNNAVVCASRHQTFMAATGSATRVYDCDSPGFDFAVATPVTQFAYETDTGLWGGALATANFSDVMSAIMPNWMVCKADTLEGTSGCADGTRWVSATPPAAADGDIVVSECSCFRDRAWSDQPFCPNSLGACFTDGSSPDVVIWDTYATARFWIPHGATVSGTLTVVVSTLPLYGEHVELNANGIPTTRTSGVPDGIEVTYVDDTDIVRCVDGRFYVLSHHELLATVPTTYSSDLLADCVGTVPSLIYDGQLPAASAIGIVSGVIARYAGPVTPDWERVSLVDTPCVCAYIAYYVEAWEECRQTISDCIRTQESTFLTLNQPALVAIPDSSDVRRKHVYVGNGDLEFVLVDSTTLVPIQHYAPGRDTKPAWAPNVHFIGSISDNVVCRVVQWEAESPVVPHVVANHHAMATLYLAGANLCDAPHTHPVFMTAEYDDTLYGQQITKRFGSVRLATGDTTAVTEECGCEDDGELTAQCAVSLAKCLESRDTIHLHLQPDDKGGISVSIASHNLDSLKHKTVWISATGTTQCRLHVETFELSTGTDSLESANLYIGDGCGNTTQFDKGPVFTFAAPAPPASAPAAKSQPVAIGVGVGIALVIVISVAVIAL